MKSRVTHLVVAFLLSATSVLAMGSAAPAGAASTVSVGGYALCSGVNGRGTVGASRVTIRLDSGGEITVGTSWLNKGRFDMKFGWMPSQGTGYTGWVTCPAGVLVRGGSWRGYLKPDWRNTTGTINFTAR